MERNFITGIVRIMIALPVMLSGIKIYQIARAHYAAEPAMMKNMNAFSEKTNKLI